MDYSFEEYKLLQEKTDKIGAFRFTIKGWSITAVVGGLIAVSADKGASPKLVAAILCGCLVWLFWFERQQVKLSWKFGLRAMSIEDQLDQVRKGNQWKDQFSSPQLANILAGRTAVDRRRRHPRHRRFLKSRREIRLAMKSDVIFYITLMALSWAPTFRHKAPSPPATPTNIIVSGDTIAVPQNSSRSAANSQLEQSNSKGPAKRGGKNKVPSEAR